LHDQPEKKQGRNNLQIPKAQIIKSEKHRRFVASKSCVICLNPYTQCCHIRSIPNYGNVGMSVRNDAFCIPMCVEHHLEQHKIGEYIFYSKYYINPVYVSEQLCKISPCKKIQGLKEGFFDEYRKYFKDNAKSDVR
jgi:hypothetical protein